MCAMTRSGHVVLYKESWCSCLYVNLDLRFRRVLGDVGEDPANGGGDDMLNVKGRLLVHRIMATKDE